MRFRGEICICIIVSCGGLALPCLDTPPSWLTARDPSDGTPLRPVSYQPVDVLEWLASEGKLAGSNCSLSLFFNSFSIHLRTLWRWKLYKFEMDSQLVIHRNEFLPGGSRLLQFIWKLQILPLRDNLIKQNVCSSPACNLMNQGMRIFRKFPDFREFCAPFCWLSGWSETFLSILTHFQKTSWRFILMPD